MNDPIRKSLLIKAPPAVVWEHLIDPVRIARWLMPNDFQPTVGASFTMRCEPQGGSNGEVLCQVKEIIAPERLVYSWTIDVPAVETLVTILLSPEAGGTRVNLEHSGWSALSKADRETVNRHDMGWDYLLGKALRELVEAP